MTSAPTINFELYPSRLLKIVMASILGLVWTSIACSGLVLWLKLVLVVLACWVWIWNRYSWLSLGSLHTLNCSNAGQWHVSLQNGQNVPAHLLSFRVLGSYIILYIAVVERGRYGILLGPDNLNGDHLRRLRMYLACRPATGPSL